MKTLFISTLLLLPASYSLAATTIDTALGQVYTDNAGKTLYTFTKDPVGQSVCNGECEKLWPPMWADEESTLKSQNWTTLSRSYVMMVVNNGH